MPTQLAELLDFDETGRTADGVDYRGVIDPVFTIGPKVHGGSLQMMVASAARQALNAVAGPDDDLTGVTALAVSSDYLAAPDPSQVDVKVRVTKRGRTVNLVHVDVVQNDRLMVSSAVTLGRQDHGEPRYRHRTPLHELPAEPPTDALHIDGTPLGEVMHLAPALDLALDPGCFPLMRGETGDPVTRGWTRPKDAADQPSTMGLDFPVLVCDLSPPVVMNLGLVGWAPTVQLTTYVRRTPAPGWLRFQASSNEVGQSMFAEDHTVLDATGAVVAQSRQLALIPAAP
ncbi:MAG: thioesterase family protein [Gordonia sp. (in: high G+C Gram-positive bacteria)]|uniref:thioesterase family protein n=1 Tax=Gordonia sp. (in: high G+C Gram-positive bacteria) TaxID=84139 RepID=UPI0039E4247B